MSIQDSLFEINIYDVFSFLFDVFVWLMDTVNGALASEAAKTLALDLAAVIVIALVARLGWAAIFEGGEKYPKDNTPDPYNGMHPSDVAFHLERGTLPDALGIWTAGILSMQETGSNLDIHVNPVSYPIGADHQTWANFVWIFQHHPDKVTNPGEIPASDYDRQRQNEMYYGKGEDEALPYYAPRPDEYQGNWEKR